MGDYALKGKVRKIFFFWRRIRNGELWSAALRIFKYIRIVENVYSRWGKVGDILVKFLFACGKNFAARTRERKGMYVKKA